MPLSAVAARKARAAALAAAAAAAAASAASAASSSDNAPHDGPSASASGSSSEKEAAAARPSKRQKRLDSAGGGSSDNDESSGTEVGDDEEDDDVQKAERLARAELDAVGHRAGRNGGGIAGSKSLRYFVGGAVGKSDSAANTEEDDDAESDDDEEPPESQAASDDGAEEEEEGGGAGGLESARQESSRGVGRRAQRQQQHQLTGANTTALHARQQPGSSRTAAASAAEAHRPLTTWRPRFGGASKNCIPVQSASKEQGAVLALGANEVRSCGSYRFPFGPEGRANELTHGRTDTLLRRHRARGGAAWSAADQHRHDSARAGRCVALIGVILCAPLCAIQQRTADPASTRRTVLCLSKRCRICSQYRAGHFALHRDHPLDAARFERDPVHRARMSRRRRRPIHTLIPRLCLFLLERSRGACLL